MIHEITPDYKLDESTLTYRQKKFIKYLSSAFNIRTALGQPIPYVPADYQKLFHSECILAKPEAKDRFLNKARGVGATMMIAMEDLALMRRYSDITVPFTSTGDDAAKKSIEWAYWLTENANVDFGVVSDNKYEISFDNGSTMVAIPGGNPKRFRNIRAPAIGFDEFAHCERQREILTAARRCMSEGGQATIVSTPIGMSNEFWQIRANYRDLDYTIFEIPLFDPAKFDITVSVYDQVSRGIVPLVPWINVPKLEEDRRYDPIAFMQENMCSPQDESVSFLSMDLIESCIDKGLYCIDQLKTKNPCFIGIDFAFARNMSAIVVIEKTIDKETKQVKYILRHLTAVKGVDTDAQVDIVKEHVRNFPISKIVVDCTGPGIGLFHNLRRLYNYKVDGINFATKVFVRSGYDNKKGDNSLVERVAKKGSVKPKDGEMVPVKRMIALNMKRHFVDGQITIFDDSLLKRDLNSVPYASLNAPKTKDLGHGDRFWAIGLALWVKAGKSEMIGGRRLTMGATLPEKKIEILPKGEIITSTLTSSRMQKW